MNTVIQEISFDKIKKLVKFPFELYKNSKQWVPPIIKDEIITLNKDKNRMLEHSDIRYFLAYQGNKVVGRVVAIVNKDEIITDAKLRFGWFDFIDDIDVSKALIDKMLELAKDYNLKYIEGPVGIANIDKAGMLTEGFELLGKPTTIYNYDYYPKHMEKLGLQHNNKWVEYKITVPEDNSRVSKISEMILKRYKLENKKMASRKDVIVYAKEMFRLMNKSFSELPTFTRMEEYQIESYVNKFSSFIHPDFVSFIFNEKEEMIGFGITIPDMSVALQKAKGRLFPFGIYHIYKAFKKPSAADLLFIGVRPDYKKKGITGIIFSKIIRTFEKKNVPWVEVGPGLESNKSVLALWSKYDATIIRRRSTFIKNI